MNTEPEAEDLSPSRATPSTPPLPPILYEDNHLLCVLKPAGMPAQADASGDPDLLSLAKEYVRVRYAKPGEVYLGLVHRLDRVVAGPMVLARTSKAAARLSEQFRDREPRKIYRAMIEGRLDPAAGERVDWMRKDAKRRLALPGRAGAPGAKEARLRYHTTGETRLTPGEANARLFGDAARSEGQPRTPGRPRELSLVEIELLTGRFHQIRFQLAAAGHPILGDVKYRSQFRLRERVIALEEVRLEIEHPVKRETLTLEWPGRLVELLKNDQ